MSAANRALQISEILYMIAHCGSRQDMLNFALTCQLFKEPGLSRVWYEINNLTHLVELMPDDVRLLYPNLLAMD